MSGHGSTSPNGGNGASKRRYGLLGFPFSRLPAQDTSYSSLDNVTWSTARALGRRGDEVVIGAWDVPPGDTAGIEVVPVDGRPDYLIRRIVKAAGRRQSLPWSSRLHHPFHLLAGVHRLRQRGAEVIEVTHEYANL